MKKEEKELFMKHRKAERKEKSKMKRETENTKGQSSENSYVSGYIPPDFNDETQFDGPSLHMDSLMEQSMDIGHSQSLLVSDANDDGEDEDSDFSD